MGNTPVNTYLFKIEALGKGRPMFIVNNKYTRTMSMTSFLYLYC